MKPLGVGLISLLAVSFAGCNQREDTEPAVSKEDAAEELVAPTPSPSSPSPKNTPLFPPGESNETGLESKDSSPAPSTQLPPEPKVQLGEAPRMPTEDSP